jgi:Xaa-Pro aminopeptidase
LERLRGLIHAQGLDALLVTNPIDVAYLTGFLGGDSYLLVEGPGGSPRPTILSDFRYEEELAPLAGLCRVVIRTGSMAEATRDLVASVKGRTGVQSEHITLADYGGLAASLGPQRVVSTSGLIAGLRAVKDSFEVGLIRRAIAVQEAALMALLPTLEPGQTELEVAARLEWEMKVRGASGASFGTIVAARSNGSLPHYRPAAVTLAAGQPLLIDWGAVVRGYRGDMTRTFALRKWPRQMRDVYAIVLEAFEAAASVARPGRTTLEVDRAARGVIEKAGYGPRFGHGLGHGIGLNGHEDPRLSHMAPPRPLEPGNVITIEPGIYIPGVGGVRIEDDFLITANAAENLCTLPRDIGWATLD